MDKLDEGLKTLLDLGKRRGLRAMDEIHHIAGIEAGEPQTAIGGRQH